MIIALDTETTGLDLHHGCKPFLVTITDDKFNTQYWEWPVDGETRQPIVSESDLDEIEEIIDEADEISFHNSKFDITALGTIRKRLFDNWPWHKTRDTLLDAHLLCSNQKKGLTELAIKYLRVDLQPFEDKVRAACIKARGIAKRKFPEIIRAELGLPMLPTKVKSWWKCDMWLPRLIAERLNYPKGECEVVNKRTSNFDVYIGRGSKWGNPFVIGKDGDRKEVIDKFRKYLKSRKDLIGALPELDGKTLGCFCKPQDCHGDILKEELSKFAHPWWTITPDYANSDSVSSIALRLKFNQLIEEEELENFSKIRHKLLPITCKMENTGIVIRADRQRKLKKHYKEESDIIGVRCENYARSDGYELTLPKSGSNNQLKDYVENGIQIAKLAPKGKQHRKRFFGKTGPKLDKNCNAHYQLELINKFSPHHKHVKFLSLLSDKRSRDTAISYLEGYQRFWIPTGIFNSKGKQLWYRIHPSLNIVGTNTLRWSSSNPNEQNISKKEGFNLRYCFGPAKGREWWSLDAQNLELRLPAYLANESEMITLFEQPNKPPYFGSYHLLIFDTLHPEKWNHDDEKGLVKAKDKYKATWYSWTKNGNFAVQYGAQEESGTADLAYKVKGAQRRIKSRFTNISRLSDECIEHAIEYGYVETVPDKTVDPDRGYPLICTRDDWGRIKPTVPLSYKIQGTAMWWMMKAMIRCSEYLDEINQETRQKFRRDIIIQVHDELVFDFPKSRENIEHIYKIKELMEEGGNDINIPTPVSIEYHPNAWSETEKHERN